MVSILISILLAIVILFIGCKVAVEWCKTELRKQGFGEFDISRLQLRGELFVARILSMVRLKTPSFEGGAGWR